MRRYHVLMTLFVIAACFVGCKNSEETPQAKEEKVAQHVEVDTRNDCLEIDVNGELYNQVETSMFKIEESRIEGMNYICTCSYSGCPNDEVTVAWNGISKRSYPSQVTIKLGIVNSGMCDMMVNKEFCISLEALRKEGKVYVTLNQEKPILLDVEAK